MQGSFRSKIGFAIALATSALGCRAGTSALEPGAVLLQLSVAPASRTPDELRIWVYADSGTLWSNVRAPAEGQLVPSGADGLGTVLLQPGSEPGALRLHVRGMAAGARVSDGVLVIAPSDRPRGTFALALEAGVPADLDGDDVPDAIDDCVAVADPDQDGCPTAGESGPDADVRSDAGPGCDATGACDRPLGAACAQADQCASSFCVDGVCCANACEGPCRSCNQPNLGGTCQGYKAGTDPELECTSGKTCDGVGACGPQAPPANKPNGSVCGAVTECASGFCKDGVCCNNACSSPCQSCGTGTCKTVTRAADPPECVSPKTCNASGKCAGT